MKKSSVLIILATMFLLAGSVFYFGGEAKTDSLQEILPAEEKGHYPDGRYRGSFFDSGDYEVALQFHIEDNTLYNLSYRHLYWRGDDYLNPECEDNELFSPADLEVLAEQHVELLEYLDGKDVSAIGDLFSPEIAAEDKEGEMVDTWSGATIRAAKVISAMRDALNRGVYRHP